MLDPLRFSTRGAGWAAAVFALLLAAGCESDHPYQVNRGPHLPPPPPLAGQESFFDGQLLAEIKTGAGFGDSGNPAEADKGGGGGGRHGGGGGHMGGGGRHGHGGGGGGSPDEASVSDTIEQDQISNIRRAAAAGGPPMMIHLRFTNHGTAKLNLSVIDFLSELGNFVVQPDQISLDPQQTVEVDPMTSRLTAEGGSSAITLVLRSAGHSEKKTISLAPIPVPPGTPAPTEPPPPPTHPT